jgi:purine-binding chemotaxis protein CheW
MEHHITEHDADAHLLQMVTFKVDGEEFGVDILTVQEIIRLIQITMVPNSPDYIEGVINLRGKVIPVVDLRRRFHKPTAERDSQTRIIVMELDGNIVGFLVDAVSEVLRISESTVEPAPPVVAGVGADYIKGVSKLEDRLLILLDLDKLLTEANAFVIPGVGQ